MTDEDSKFTTSDIAGHAAHLLGATLSIDGKPVSPKIVRSQTTTGSEQITLDFGGRDKFHVTITRARR